MIKWDFYTEMIVVLLIAIVIEAIIANCLVFSLLFSEIKENTMHNRTDIVRGIETEVFHAHICEIKSKK